MQRNKAVQWFTVLWIAYSVVLGTAILVTDKLELHRLMHPYHSPALDLFFSWCTHLGDGLVPTAIALFLLFFKDLRSFLMMAVGCTVSALLAQFLKQVVFPDHDRPFMFKALLGDMHWVPGLELHHHFSFPSGHTTAAFSMCFALTVLLGTRAWGMALAMIAMTLAYSRVYLSQHFSEDILVGAALGTLTSLLVYWWLYRSPVSTKRWLDRKLIHFPK